MPKVKQEQPSLAKEGPWLAINLFDIDRVNPAIRGMLLSGLVELKAIRVVEHKPDETAVAFTCDLLRAATICDIIRNHDRAAGDYPTRVYLKKITVWDRLSYDAQLTLMVDDKAVLNRKLLGLPGDVIQDDDFQPQAVL